MFLWHTRVSRDKKSVPLRGATVRRRRAFSAFAGPRRASTPVPGFVLPSSSLLARAMKSHATMACGGCRRRRLHVLLHGCGEQTEPRAEGCERRGFLKARLSRCHMLAAMSPLPGPGRWPRGRSLQLDASRCRPRLQRGGAFPRPLTSLAPPLFPLFQWRRRHREPAAPSQPRQCRRNPLKLG